jgi:hypothetical protein
MGRRLRRKTRQRPSGRVEVDDDGAIKELPSTPCPTGSGAAATLGLIALLDTRIHRPTRRNPAILRNPKGITPDRYAPGT